MDMKTIGLTTKVFLDVPEEITVNGQKARAEKDWNDETDWIEYYGPYGKWTITIWMMDSTNAGIRASVFGDGIDTAVIDITKDDDLTAAIAELCGEIERELAKGE